MNLFMEITPFDSIRMLAYPKDCAGLFSYVKVKSHQLTRMVKHCHFQWLQMQGVVISYWQSYKIWTNISQVMLLYCSMSEFHNTVTLFKEYLINVDWIN